jgi:hypothetical protein
MRPADPLAAPFAATFQAWRSLPLIAVFVGAALLRPLIGTNIDVSWLITIGEKMLAGERLYVDIVEVNPPASAFLYLPAIVLARAIGLAPEIVVDALVLVAAGLSIFLTGLILRAARLVDHIDGWLLAALAAAILTILPMQTFGEREHIAVIALLPALAVLAARANKIEVAFWSVVAAGIGSAIAIIIKPHFALPFALAALACAYAARSWRILFAPENWIAAALAAGYGVFVVVAYPEFIRDVMPMVTAVYIPPRLGLVRLLTTPAIACFAGSLALLAVWKRREILAPPLSLLVAIAIGFAAVYLIQGKGWPYHSYPMLAFAFVALAVAESRPKRAVQDRLAILPIVALAAISCLWLNVVGRFDYLAEPIRRLHPHPSMLVISTDLTIGHPLVRRLGGTWVSRVGGLWISAGVHWRLTEETLDAETKALLLRYAARDRDMLVEDIRGKRPDIVIVEKGEFDWEAWTHADPQIAAALRDYRTATVVGRFLILAREPAR